MSVDIYADIVNGKKVVIDIDEYLELKNTKYKDQFIDLTIMTEKMLDGTMLPSTTKISYSINDTDQLEKLNSILSDIATNVQVLDNLNNQNKDYKDKLENAEYFKNLYSENNAKLKAEVDRLTKLKIPFYKRIFKKTSM